VGDAPAKGWELTRAIEVVVHHRWKRRWPKQYATLSDDYAVFAIEPIEQALERAGADEAEWFDVLPVVLDEGAWIFDYLLEGESK
jgi:hypothetical protein